YACGASIGDGVVASGAHEHGIPAQQSRVPRARTFRRGAGKAARTRKGNPQFRNGFIGIKPFTGGGFYRYMTRANNYWLPAPDAGDTAVPPLIPHQDDVAARAARNRR